MAGFALDPSEFDKLKATLRDASTALSLRDFTTKASLEGGLTTQSVSPHENVEETVDEVIMALTKFVDRDYPQATQAVQDFINLMHTTLSEAVNAVHQTQLEYQQSERLVGDGMNRILPGG